MQFGKPCKKCLLSEGCHPYKRCGIYEAIPKQFERIDFPPQAVPADFHSETPIKTAHIESYSGKTDQNACAWDKVTNSL